MKLGLCAAAALAACAAPASAATFTFTYTGAGGALPDNVNFFSTIVVPTNFVIQDVNFTLNNLQHTFWADLVISLSKGATTVTVTDDNGGGTDPNGTFTFDDEASTSVTAINTTGGSFIPLNPLSAFDGGTSAGVWTLNIFDDAGFDAGRFDSWTLTLTGNLAGAVPEPSTWTMLILGFGAAGAGMRRKAAAGTKSRAKLTYA